MKTKYEDVTIFQGYTGKERVLDSCKRQRERPQDYFEMEAGNKLTGIRDKTATYLYVPEGITRIDSFAFAGCQQLNGVFLPRTVESIGSSLFADCPRLTFLIVEPENPYYDSRNDCNAIIDQRTGELIAGCRSTIVPEDIKGIGAFAFYMQDGLKSITIPAHISYISNCAFKDCRQLVDVKLPKHLQKIGMGAFAGCTSLLDVVIPETITDIEENAFEGVDHVWYRGQSKKAPWGAWNMNES